MADGGDFHRVGGEAIHDAIAPIEALAQIGVTVFGDHATGSGISRDGTYDSHDVAGEDPGVALRIVGDVLDDPLELACGSR